MKRILFVFLALVMSISVTSCESPFEKDKEKFIQQMNIPGDDNSFFVFGAGITKNKKNYYYTDYIRKELNNKKEEITSSILFNDVIKVNNIVFMKTKYTNNAYNNKYILGYMNIFDLNYHSIKLTTEDSKIYQMGNYVIYVFSDHMEIYDESIKKEEIQIEGILKGVYPNGIVQSITKDHSIKITDVNLKTYSLTDLEHNVTDNISIKEITNNYIILSAGSNNLYGYYYKTGLKMNDEETKAIINNNKQTREYIGGREEFFFIQDHKTTTLLTMSELRETNEEISTVENIFNSQLSFRDVYLDDDIIYTIIGNTDSFFGAYRSGCTYSMVYQYNKETNTLKYVGCYGSIHSPLLGVEKITNK